jgi:hypothetical protein
LGWGRETNLATKNKLFKFFLINPVHTVHYD